jgi:hypothetical protein
VDENEPSKRTAWDITEGIWEKGSVMLPNGGEGEKQTTVDENEPSKRTAWDITEGIWEKGSVMLPNGGKEKNKQRWMRMSPASEQLKDHPPLLVHTPHSTTHATNE